MLYSQDAFINMVPDMVLRICLNPEDYVDSIAKAHVSIGSIHAFETQTMQRILLSGF